MTKLTYQTDKVHQRERSLELLINKSVSTKNTYNHHVEEAAIKLQ